LFDLFKKVSQEYFLVTFGIYLTRSSWIDNFPLRGRKDYPLLFDAQLKPKKAYLGNS
jgi:endo-1,4-beta-xylanase